MFTFQIRLGTTIINKAVNNDQKTPLENKTPL